MRLSDGSCRTSGRPFIGIFFVLGVVLTVCRLWLLRLLSLLALLSLVAGLPLLPGLIIWLLRLLALLVALLILHRVVAGLLPLVLLVFFIRIHVVFLLEKVVKQTTADEVPG